MILLRELSSATRTPPTRPRKPSTHLVEEARAAVLQATSTPRRTSMWRSSPPTPAARSSWSASPIPFAARRHYLLTFDNHNSVNGIREFARARGAEVTYIPVCLPDIARGRERAWPSCLDRARPGGHNLFAFPAQSNFSGVQHPLDWIEQAHAKGWDGSAGCGRLCAHQPPRPQPLETGLRAALVLQDVRLSDRRWLPAGAAKRRWPGCTGRGSPAAPSPSPRCRATSTTWASGEMGFEDGTLNYLAPARSRRSGCGTSQSVGMDTDPRAGALPDRLAARPPAIRAASQWPAR